MGAYYWLSAFSILTLMVHLHALCRLGMNDIYILWHDQGSLYPRLNLHSTIAFHDVGNKMWLIHEFCLILDWTGLSLIVIIIEIKDDWNKSLYFLAPLKSAKSSRHKRKI